VEKSAIISVYDKTNLDIFARELSDLGVKIFSTGGTARYLKELGIPVHSVSEYTGHPEILEGRVKSLHPKIHGGILARRNLDSDLKDLKANEINLFDYVVVNLYPFTKKVEELVSNQSSANVSLIEDIDIGGPTLLRAAAKNCEFVLPVCDPSDYPRIISMLKEQNSIPIELRRELATKTFATTASYDSAVSKYFSLGEKVCDEQGRECQLAPIEGIVLSQKMSLRYGENPHQKAALYEKCGVGEVSQGNPWNQIQGKDLSYNNLLDMFATLELFLDLWKGRGEREAAVVIKHSNPCGAALADTGLDAFTSARACDPVSAFGGIVALSGELNAETAEAMNEGFLEVLCVESLSDDAKRILGKKKNLRVILCDFKKLDALREKNSMMIRNAFGSYLVQSADLQLATLSLEEQVCGAPITESEMNDLDFAHRIAKHVKSNAIVIVKDLQAIGVGAGQMSRVDSARLAVSRARSFEHGIAGAVAASDAFLPFPDTLEILNDAGVNALIQPGGSIKDDTVIDVAKKRNVKMIFTGERHFKH
jgi:phosphoribosylaminoimidazolecarboxamide formyltransferase/IMP cyclohydrolase